MPLIRAYHRPKSLHDALELLAAGNRLVLAGGTTVNSDREHSELEVVDLQALGLSAIEESGDRLVLGATATLAEVASHPSVPAALQQIAKTEEPSTTRTLATVGGAVASGDGESVFLAALLVHGATVQMAGADDTPLRELLQSGVPQGDIVTSVSIDPTGTTATATTGRTPRDVPIVAAVARQDPVGDTTLALTGVSEHPSMVDPDDPVAGLTPPEDFRGSSAYRLHLARTLSARAREALR